MKKNNLYAFSIALLATFVVSDASSQSDFLTAAKLNKSGLLNMPTEVTAPEKSTSLVMKDENAKVAQAFARNFKDPGNITWSKGLQKKYMARFNSNGRNTLAVFNKTGHLFCTAYFGSEKEVPSREKSIIQHLYEDYAITGSIELNVKDQKAWIITIRNGNHLKKVKILDGVPQVIESRNVSD